MATKTMCDKCGKDITASPKYAASAHVHGIEIAGEYAPTFGDLCKGCVETMFSVYPREAVTRRAVQDEEVKRG